MIDLAVLLCAGSSTRLRPLTDDRPKCLLDVGGETILARAVRTLLSVGMRRLVIATGYREKDVEKALAGCPAEVTFCHNLEYATTQNAVSLYKCRFAVEANAFLKLDGDVLFEREVIERVVADRAELSVAVEKRDDLGEEEMKVIVERGQIRAFGKNLDPRRSFGESIGIEKIERGASEKLFAGLARAYGEGRTDLYYEDIYGELIEQGLNAHAVDVSDLPWIEIDTAEDLARARQSVAQGGVNLRNV